MILNATVQTVVLLQMHFALRVVWRERNLHCIAQNACGLLLGGGLQDVQRVHVSHTRVNIKKPNLGLNIRYLLLAQNA